MLDSLGGASPEWRPWLTLLGETLQAMDEPAWEAAVPEPNRERPAEAPLLDGTVLTADPRLARDWVRRLLETAAKVGGPDAAALAPALMAGRLDALGLIEAAIRQDEGRLSDLAASAEVEPGALAAIAQLAAMPLLQACHQRLSQHVPSTWPHGYCPICGAWPAMAEVQGLERIRKLRCGRCGAGWRIELLRCPYCRTDNFRRLGSLVPEENGEIQKVDICHQCKGYVKTITILHSWPGHRVALEDLASVHLDLVALARGHARPQRPGYNVDVRIIEAAPARRRLLGWRS